MKNISRLERSFFKTLFAKLELKPINKPLVAMPATFKKLQIIYHEPKKKIKLYQFCFKLNHFYLFL